MSIWARMHKDKMELLRYPKIVVTSIDDAVDQNKAMVEAVDCKKAQQYLIARQK